jgi:hypothetical protein
LSAKPVGAEVACEFDLNAGRPSSP